MRARALAAVLGAAALSWLLPALAGSVTLKFRAEPEAAARGLHLVLVDLPNPQITHCRGTKILTLDADNADVKEWGGSRWSRTLDLDSAGAKRTESLVLCIYEGERLKPLWSGQVRNQAGKRLIGLDCWVGESLELDCAASYGP